MNANPKTVVIAGAGLAGMAAAVFLDELGFKVTLLEKKSILGGRTFSFTDKKTNIQIDNGQHLMIGAYHETIALLERLGAKHKIAIQRPSVVPLFNDKFTKAHFRLGKRRPPWGLVEALVRYSGFTIAEKISLLGLGRELRCMARGKKDLPKHLTVTAWLRENGQSESAIKNFWEVLTLATLNDAADVASADALVTVLIKSYFAGPDDGHLVFPQTSLTDLFVNPVLTYLEQRRQEVRPGIGLKEIKILNGRVQGFLLTDGSVLKADVYVAALPHHRLLGVLPEPFVDATPTLKPLRSFRHSPIVSINLFFDRPIMDEVFVGSSTTSVHWFFNKHRSEEKRDGIHHIIGVISGAYDLVDKDKDDIVRLALEDLRSLYPAGESAELLHSLVNIERQATMSCGVGVNDLRPRQKVLENFYVIGDWTATGLPPTIESAVVSAKCVWEDLRE